MAIELRLNTTGEGMVVVACVHCGEHVKDAGDGLVVWRPDGDPDPMVGIVFYLDYAHRGCEERFLESLPIPEARELSRIFNLPIAELFGMLRLHLVDRPEAKNDVEV